MKQFFSLLYLLISYTPLFAGIIRVGPGHAFQTIASAIAAATINDTVLVEKGMYHEHNLTIQKSIVLIGVGFPVLDGEHQYEIIAVKADHVLISGFRLQNSGQSSIVDIAGIKVYDRQFVTISNNILQNTFFGIYIQNGRKCLIQNNVLSAHQTEEQQSGNGIHCWKCDSLQIIGI